MKRPTRLTAAFVRAVKEPGVYGDGRGGFGLSLRVRESTYGGTTKSWVQRLYFRRERMTLGLGSYPLITLSEARKRAFLNRQKIALGEDPRGVRAPTFAEACERVIRLRAKSWKTGSPLPGEWRALFRKYAFPRFGDTPVSKVTRGDVFDAVKAIWHEKPAAAKHLLQRVGVVMQWAIAKGYRDSDPTTGVRAALPNNGGSKHHAALPHGELRDVLARLSGHPVTVACLRFIAATAVRSGEARGARWSEIEGDTWVIPARRMKTAREHRVPLSWAALAILADMRKRYGASGLVFPSARGKVLHRATVTRVLRSATATGTVHGLRTAFRSHAAEAGVDRQVAESCLAHVVKGVEGAYQRSDLLERRRNVMQAWGDYIMPL